jgi:ADP-ribosylglycohydrolase
MIGAIAGDIIGSVYEAHPIKTVDFPLFSSKSRYTDDTVLTVAVAYSMLNDVDYASAFKYFGRMFPDAGYGGSFITWLLSEDNAPYNSWGNGSAMRVSPVGFAYSTFDRVLAEAKKTAEVTHNHLEGIKGAQAVAAAVYLARTGNNKHIIKDFIADTYLYDLNRTISDIRTGYTFDVSCQGSVPEAIIAFLESNSFTDAVRKAVSLGGDSDTQACIAGAIAHAYYQHIPREIMTEVRDRVPPFLLDIVDQFTKRYRLPTSTQANETES